MALAKAHDGWIGTIAAWELLSSKPDSKIESSSPLRKSRLASNDRDTGIGSPGSGTAYRRFGVSLK